MIRISLVKKLTGADGPFELTFSTAIKKGELISLYGPTGSGKSSVLRMVAGLMRPDSGFISLGDDVWFNNEKRIDVIPQKRSVGMVFQDYSLFPNMTVRQNLEFALSPGQDRQIVDELLEISGLGNFAGKRPTLLSGGQRQRVALARAMVRMPAILLLDEPLSALDTRMRATLQDYILDFHRRFNLTIILVSHDLNEVIKMSRRVLVLEGGTISKDCEPRMISNF